MPADQVSKEEYVQWKSSRVTQQLIQDLFFKREAIKEGWAEGQHSDESQRLMDIGRCQGLKDTIQYIQSDFNHYNKEEDLDDVDASVASDSD